MNKSLDLRNRILKMRESNKIVLDQFKSETKITDTYSEIIPKKTQNDLNSSELNVETKLDKEISSVESKKIDNSNLSKRKSISSNINNEENSNKQTLDNLFYDNEAQFRMIAKKFNEAVEVILELSDKVKNLEETVHNLSVKSIKNNSSQSFFNLKTFVLILIITLFLIGMFAFPIDIMFIKLIIKDVISSI